MSGIVGGIQNRNSVVGEAYATTDDSRVFTLKNDTNLSSDPFEFCEDIFEYDME